MRNNILKTGLGWLWVAVLVLGLDRVTKVAVQHYLIAYDAVPVMPGFNLILSFNRGAAFSFLNSENGWQVWFFGLIACVVSAAIMVWLAHITSKQRWTAVALSLIAGGALGNLWDRISYGHVIDFIQFYVSDYYWPTFNIADSAICMGAIMLFMQSLRAKQSQ